MISLSESVSQRNFISSNKTNVKHLQAQKLKERNEYFPTQQKGVFFRTNYSYAEVCKLNVNVVL